MKLNLREFYLIKVNEANVKLKYNLKYNLKEKINNIKDEFIYFELVWK